MPDKTDKQVDPTEPAVPRGIRRARIEERVTAGGSAHAPTSSNDQDGLPGPEEDEFADSEAADVADGEDLPGKLYFRIGEVSQLVGVDTHVLRYWESEFKMKPHRSSSGQRLYRRQDLSRFLRIKALLHEEGYTIAGARKAMSGGSSTPAIDPAMLADALQRLESLRSRIHNLRREVEPKGG